MRIRKKIDQIGKYRIQIGPIKTDIYGILANFSTIVNLCIGITISVLILLNNALDPLLTTRLIVLGASFDAVDGRLARLSTNPGHLGAQFDTAADQITFATAPGLMIIHQLYPFNQWFAFILGLAYFFTGSFRLSRYVMAPTSNFFEGMPSPVSAIFIAAWYIQPDITIPLYAGSVMLISLLMISSLPYTGMKVVTTWEDKFYFVFTVSMMLLLTYSPNSWMVPLGKVWIAYIIYFCVYGPSHAKRTMDDSKSEK